MFLSVFDMFKIGIGPSSSHTMGPMVAAARFLDRLRASPFSVSGLAASLHGSLAFTGVGHAHRPGGDPRAGRVPARRPTTPSAAEAALAAIRARRHASRPPGLPELALRPRRGSGLRLWPALPGHANGMILKAPDAQGDVILAETYYSIGGGFVLTAAELAAGTRQRRRPAGALSVQDRRRDAGDVPRRGPDHRRAEARQRADAAHRRRISTPGIAADLAGDGRLHRPRAGDRRHPARRAERAPAGARRSTTRCWPSAA